MRRFLMFVAIAALAGCASTQAQVSTSHTREVQGERTIATLLEDFDQGPAVVQILPRVDKWGDRVGSSRGSVSVGDAGTGGIGKAAVVSFQASFDEPYSIERWQDSGLSFISRIELGRPGAGAQGLNLRMKLSGFTLVELVLSQESPGGTRAYYLGLFENEGEWKEWKIPFASFAPADAAPPIDLSRPLAVEAYIPYMENWNAYHFRTGAEAKCAILFDNIGFWRSRGQDAAPGLEGFDDERDRMPFTVDLYGSSVWTDYTQSDSGQAKINAGVKSQKLTLSRKPGGPEGGYLELSGRLDLDPAIKVFHKAGQTLTVFLKAPFGQPVKGAGLLSFLVRSDMIQSGGIEVQDEVNGQYYGNMFAVNESWSRARIPFDRLMASDKSLAEAEKVTDSPRLQLAFELAPDEVERALAVGWLEFSIALDSFALEQ